MKRVAIRFLLLAISVLIGLAAVEVALRLGNLFRPPNDPPRPRRADLYQADERVGYRLWTSTKMCYRYPVSNGRVLSVNSNSDGFRSEREFDEPDSRTRIVVTGDSFVFGDGVEIRERLTEVLEGMEPGWRVDNLGMTGWGIDLMIRAVETIGPKARPDVVVLGIYTDDFTRQRPFYSGMGFPTPRFRLERGSLVSAPYPRLAWWKSLRVVQAAYQSYWRLVPDPHELNNALFDRFLAEAQRQEFMPVLMFIPGKYDGRVDSKRRRFLDQFAKEQGVAYLDLTEPIHGAGVDNTYIRGNWHWNPAGHRIAALELHRLLKARGLDRARSESTGFPTMSVPSQTGSMDKTQKAVNRLQSLAVRASLTTQTGDGACQEDFGPPSG